MKPLGSRTSKSSTVLVLFLGAVGAWAAADPKIGQAQPTGTPAPSIKIIISPTFTPVPATLIAPASAPSEADAPGARPVPKKAPKGPSRWRSSMALGGALPRSADLQSNYPLGFNASLGSGYQFSDLFSEWIVLDFDHFDPRGGQAIQYNIVGLALLTKVNFTDSTISPFLFAGPGVAYNEIRSTTAQEYDYYTGEYYLPVNAYEVDFMAEGGLGVEWKLAETFRLILQGKVTFNFISPSFAANALADSPSFLIPLQIGMDLGL